MEAGMFFSPIITRFRPIEIDYGKNIRNLVRDGWFGYVNRHFTSTNLPAKKSGRSWFTPVLLHYNDFVESKDVVADIKRRGLEPADEREGLAFANRYPQEQRISPIICLGRVIRVNSKDYIVCLDECSVDGRKVRLVPWNDRRLDGERFLALEVL